MDDFKVESGGVKDEEYFIDSLPTKEPETQAQKCVEEVNAILAKYNCTFSPEIIISEVGIRTSVLIKEIIKKLLRNKE
jgi:hypothetical protein